MMDITGLSKDMSTTYLEMMNFNIEEAIEMWQNNNNNNSK